jgi:hypothetical protein
MQFVVHSKPLTLSLMDFMLENDFSLRRGEASIDPIILLALSIET